MALGAAAAVDGPHQLTLLRLEVTAAQPLGRYRLVRRLGTGGMKRPCAVKLIRPERAGDQTLAHRFAREVQATTRRNHRAAVRVPTAGELDAALATCWCVADWSDAAAR
jgi:serine/threonine-protein kinase